MKLDKFLLQVFWPFAPQSMRQTLRNYRCIAALTMSSVRLWRVDLRLKQALMSI